MDFKVKFNQPTSIKYLLHNIIILIREIRRKRCRKRHFLFLVRLILSFFFCLLENWFFIIKKVKNERGGIIILPNFNIGERKGRKVKT